VSSQRRRQIGANSKLTCGGGFFFFQSTARIGASPESGVVDPRLRVFGVKGLRVVDASVFPSLISGHPAASVVAVAEKAADIIKADAETTQIT